MSPLLGVHAIAAVVLIVAGAAKVVRPTAARDAIRAARLPASPLAVRGVGAFELGVGATALVVAGPVPALAVAGTYLAFQAFIIRSRAVGADAGCGCFGVAEPTQPGAIHLALNTVLAVGSGAAALGDISLFDRLVDQPGQGLALTVLAAVGAYLVVVADTLLPAARSQLR